MCVGPQGQFQCGPHCGEQTKVFTRETVRRAGRDPVVLPLAQLQSSHNKLRSWTGLAFSGACLLQTKLCKVPQAWWSLPPARMGNSNWTLFLPEMKEKVDKIPYFAEYLSEKVKQATFQIVKL